MSLFNIFEISASAMSAQSVRLNTVASNLANAGTVASSPDAAYKAKMPIFKTVMQDTLNGANAGVQVKEIVTSNAPAQIQHNPDHPLADANGNVYLSNVNAMTEMANMMSASRSYQAVVETANTSKQMLLQTLRLGQ